MKAIHLAVRSQRNIWPIHCHPSWLVFCLIWFCLFRSLSVFPPQTLTQCKLNTVDLKFRVHALWVQHKLLLLVEELARFWLQDVAVNSTWCQLCDNRPRWGYCCRKQVLKQSQSFFIWSDLQCSDSGEATLSSFLKGMWWKSLNVILVTVQILGQHYFELNP